MLICIIATKWRKTVFVHKKKAGKTGFYNGDHIGNNEEILQFIWSALPAVEILFYNFHQAFLIIFEFLPKIFIVVSF